MSNTQGENENAILTSKRLNNLDALSKTLKVLKINNARYYESDENDAKFDPASNPKVATHTSDGKKIKVMDTNNINLEQILLSNLTLLIITTTIDPWVLDIAVICGGTTNDLMTPTTKGVIMDAACIRTRILHTPGRVIRTGRDGTTPHDRDVVVSSPQDNGLVMIGGFFPPQPWRILVAKTFSIN